MRGKRFIALLLSLVMLFTFTAPAFAGEDAQVSVVSEEGEGTVRISFLGRIKDILHRIIERILGLFGRECPICEKEGSGLDYTPEEIAAAYNKAVNDLKAYKGELNINRMRSVSSIVRNPSASSVTSIIEAIAENYDGATVDNFSFSNGTADDGSKITDKVMPFGRDASLASAGTVMSSAKKTGNTTKLEFVLTDETSYFDGTSVTEDAVHNSSVAETVNYGEIDAGTLSVLEATTTYDGTEIKAELDTQGRLVSLVITMSMDISAVCKAGPVSFQTEVYAIVTERYIFNYSS